MGRRKSRTKTISSLLIWLDRCNIISNSTIVFIVNLLLILHHSISTAYNDCLSTDRCHISYGEAAHGPWPIVYQSAHVTWLDIQRENLAIYADLLSCRRLKKTSCISNLVVFSQSFVPRACVRRLFRLSASYVVAASKHQPAESASRGVAFLLSQSLD